MSAPAERSLTPESGTRKVKTFGSSGHSGKAARTLRNRNVQTWNADAANCGGYLRERSEFRSRLQQIRKPALLLSDELGTLNQAVKHPPLIREIRVRVLPDVPTWIASCRFTKFPEDPNLELTEAEARQVAQLPQPT